ncbi:long-chain fatty acid--CoA ligase [Pseudomonas sp. H9]|uniref:acyl-CoA synthetase n=1 Tax=Pseudomonas sp. H9 TaxID=483968 RepID=UPI0010582B2D|nr:long-chain fatty acid--CoA ligase [Pseudomonas sp. H9]TDF83856.1 long-chain-fatty-acid--CoA ligase [Pseudomonas sp. H9]
MYLTQGLHRSLQLNPDWIATTFRGRQRTFRQTGDRVSCLASGLRAVGMEDNDRIGMLALNSDRYMEFMLAVWWGGGVINPVNVRWSVPEIVYSLDDCDTRILFVDDNFLTMTEAICTMAKYRPLLIHVGDGPTPEGMLSFEKLIAESESMKDRYRGGDDIAAIMYTGGTTGQPKGVMQSHLNLWSSAVMALAEHPPLANSIVLHAAPMFHTACMARVIGQLVAGGRHVFIPMFDPLDVLQTIERERVSETLLVPIMLQALIMHPAFAQYDISSFKRLTYGAAPIAESVLQRALVLLPGVEFMHGYGMTETSPVIARSGPENHSAASIANGRFRSAGRPIQGVAVLVVDGEGREVPRGEVGEVIVRGANVMLGYWNRPEETAQALCGGWMHTGDGAYMDADGYLFIVDRIKDMIVTGGENVYCGEVESAVTAHPAVAACAVIGIPSEQWGEAVHAVVVLKPGLEVSGEEVIAHCRQHIAGYKCPKSVDFVTALPISGAGKVLKRDLRAPYWKDHKHGVS